MDISPAIHSFIHSHALQSDQYPPQSEDCEPNPSHFMALDIPVNGRAMYGHMQDSVYTQCECPQRLKPVMAMLTLGLLPLRHNEDVRRDTRWDAQVYIKSFHMRSFAVQFMPTVPSAGKYFQIWIYCSNWILEEEYRICTGNCKSVSILDNSRLHCRYWTHFVCKLLNYNQSPSKYRLCDIPVCYPVGLCKRTNAVL